MRGFYDAFFSSLRYLLIVGSAAARFVLSLQQPSATTRPRSSGRRCPPPPSPHEDRGGPGSVRRGPDGDSFAEVPAEVPAATSSHEDRGGPGRVQAEVPAASSHEDRGGPGRVLQDPDEDSVMGVPDRRARPRLEARQPDQVSEVQVRRLAQEVNIDEATARRFLQASGGLYHPAKRAARAEAAAAAAVATPAVDSEAARKKSGEG